jgi:solute:Na+ symporter, SSS family
MMPVEFSMFSASPVLASALESESAGGGLTVIDWAIVVLYAASTIGLGWYFSRRQKTVKEYFVGSGHMNPLLIGVSLFATLLSTISYLSMPGEALGKGPAMMLATLGYPFVFLVVGFVLLPVYMRHRVTSAYELLEEKLGLSVRMLGAGMFLALRLVWMSLLIYLTSKALTEMTGIGDQAIPYVAMVTGAVAVTYTTLGGLRAVVITDFLQTVLLYGGAVLVIGTVTVALGGFSWVPTQWNPNWDTQPLYSFDPSVRVTILGVILNMFIWHVCTAGGDQTSVQRFMSTKDLRAARWAIATQMTVAIIVAVTLAFVGFALLGYFSQFPERLPEGLTLKDDADKMFPHFIAHHLPVGISGLVVAAMFAAAMSSMDSGVNSITAVVTTDFFDRFGKSPRDERDHVRLARILAFSIGVIVVLGSSQMGRVPGNITAMTQKTSNLLTTPIFCLFFFALFVPFARPAGVWAGAICGTLTAATIAFSGPLVELLVTQFQIDPQTFGVDWQTKTNSQTGETTRFIPDPISFQWIAPVAVIVNITVGSLVSLLTRLRR